MALLSPWLAVEHLVRCTRAVILLIVMHSGELWYLLRNSAIPPAELQSTEELRLSAGLPMGLCFHWFLLVLEVSLSAVGTRSVWRPCVWEIYNRSDCQAWFKPCSAEHQRMTSRLSLRTKHWTQWKVSCYMTMKTLIWTIPLSLLNWMLDITTSKHFAIP